MAITKQIITPEEQRRTALYEKMTPDLRKVVDRFGVLAAKEARGHILLRYDMGTQIQAIIQEESKYGANAVGQLADYFDTTETDLYDLRNMTLTFAREEVEQLAQRPMAKGGYINYKHLIGVSKVKKATDRTKLLDRVFVESLSANQVATEVSAAYDKKNTRSGGRKPSKPTSPAAGAQILYEQTLGLNNRLESLKEPLFDEIDQMPVDKLDAVLLERLKKADEQITALEERITGYHERLRGNIERAEKAVEAQAKKRDADVAAAKAEASKLDGKKPRRPSAA